MVIPKPAHLASQYGGQFKDEAIVAAYHHRPPYPEAVFPLLVELIGAGPRVVLDVGCGTGDIARRLAPCVDRLDAVDFSAPMIGRGRTLPGGKHSALRWIEGAVEDVPLDPPYGLIVAGESLHWMDWGVVFPRLRTMLATGAMLAILGRTTLAMSWDEDLQRLISRYSTNRDFQPYDFVDELTKHHLFTVQGACSLLPEMVSQRIDSFVESFHSRNGFSRDRMEPRDADAFDAGVANVMQQWAEDGQVVFPHTAHIAWGLPESPETSALSD